jgi:hypothetical protein
MASSANNEMEDSPLYLIQNLFNHCIGKSNSIKDWDGGGEQRTLCLQKPLFHNVDFEKIAKT